MLLGWPAGYWIVGAKVGLLQCWSAGFGRGILLQKEQGRRRAGEGFARGRCVPLGNEFSVRKSVYQCVYLSPMGWPCIYSICFPSWMVNRILSHWIGVTCLYRYWIR